MGPAAASPDDWQGQYDQSGLPEATKDERNWGMFFHLSHLVMLIVGIPIVAPLVMWLAKKDQSFFLDDHGREAVNFEISLILWGFIGAVVMLMTCGVGVVLLAAVWLLGILGTVMGLVAASNGRYYRYPATFRFIK